MKGATISGTASEHNRRELVRAVPRGALTRSQVSDLQRQIATGLKTVGYSNSQISQVIERDERTIYRYLNPSIVGRPAGI